MAVSDAQYNRLLARMSKAEEAINDIIIAQGSFITLSQLNQLMVLTQTEQDVLTEQVTSNTTRITALEEESYQ